MFAADKNLFGKYVCMIKRTFLSLEIFWGKPFLYMLLALLLHFYDDNIPVSS